MSILTDKAENLQQIVKDLSWVIASPGLVKENSQFYGDKFFEQEYAVIKQSIQALQYNSLLLTNVFHDSKPFVGDYFERLVLLWLHLNPNYDNIQHHIRVYKDKQTVGELDFLFLDTRENQFYHWEVAVKFFLLYQDSKGETHYLGPNAKDSFTRKFNKLSKHQIPLSQNQQAQITIQKHTQNTPVRAKGIMKGRLFYPVGASPQIPETFKSIVSPQHLQGWWTRSNDANLPQHSEHSVWLPLDKPYWFSLPDVNIRKTYNFSEIQRFIADHFHTSSFPLLLAELVHHKQDWQEISRGFIVHENWPNGGDFD